MSIRKVTLFASLVIISGMITASFIAWNPTVKIVLFVSIVITAAALIVAYIFQGWADFEALRAEVDQLRAEAAGDRALAKAHARRIEVGLEHLKRDLYSELAVRSMQFDDPSFVEAMNRLLVESGSTMEQRDG